MLLPLQVDRISWAPIKAVEESDELNHTDTHTRPFCRILESTVPMYCNLEVNLHLAVVDLKVAAPDIAGVDMPTGGWVKVAGWLGTAGLRQQLQVHSCV